MNVGLWEEKAHKQWCKFDITDPLEFQFLFDWKTKYGNRQGSILRSSMFALGKVASGARCWTAKAARPQD